MLFLGSSWPKPCPAGRFASEIGLSACNLCMEGYYCPGNQSSYYSFPCPKGYFCPNGSKSAYENPCKPGTFNGRLRRTKENDCLACPPGYYCPESGKICLFIEQELKYIIFHF